MTQPYTKLGEDFSLKDSLQPESLLEFRHVFYGYPGAKNLAIDDLSLSLPKGKKTVLLGHNGCGKSTLFFLADGLYRCRSGEILWRGEPLHYDRQTLNRWRQRIGLAFQDPEQQLVAATVAEDISYGLCNLDLPEPELRQRLQQTIADFDLEFLAHQPLHALSLGQKRRVALAGVMALQPELLLLDEPTSYLDRQQTASLFQELDRIQAAGTTIVMATHDLDLAYAWADWAIILAAGRVVAADHITTIFEDRSLLAQVKLDLPVLLDLWFALPAAWRDRHLPPRSIEELKLFLADRFGDPLS